MMSFQQGRLLAWMCLSTGWPCGAHSVQILTAPETESPKKAWFIQSGLSDLAVVKGPLQLFSSDTVHRSLEFHDCLEGGSGKKTRPGWEVEGSWERILEERVYLDYTF